MDKGWRQGGGGRRSGSGSLTPKTMRGFSKTVAKRGPMSGRVAGKAALVRYDALKRSSSRRSTGRWQGGGMTPTRLAKGQRDKPVTWPTA